MDVLRDVQLDSANDRARLEAYHFFHAFHWKPRQVCSDGVLAHPVHRHCCQWEHLNLP